MPGDLTWGTPPCLGDLGCSLLPLCSAPKVDIPSFSLPAAPKVELPEFRWAFVPWRVAPPPCFTMGALWAPLG